MSLFNAILQDIEKKMHSKHAYKKTVSICVKEVLNYEISPECIMSLKDSILVLQLPGTIKMALLLKKEKLIKRLQEYGVVVSEIK